MRPVLGSLAASARTIGCPACPLLTRMTKTRTGVGAGVRNGTRMSPVLGSLTTFGSPMGRPACPLTTLIAPPYPGSVPVVVP